MRAFTLIEALAVVAILAIVAATLSVSLGETAHATTWQRARSAVRQFDRLARLEARTNGPIQIAIDGNSIVASRGRDLPPLLRSDPFAPGNGHRPSVALVAVDRPPGMGGGLTVISCVQLDGAGRSIDFAYQLNDGPELIRVHAAGLTGHLSEESE